VPRTIKKKKLTPANCQVGSENNTLQADEYRPTGRSHNATTEPHVLKHDYRQTSVMFRLETWPKHSVSAIAKSVSTKILTKRNQRRENGT